MSDSSDMQAYYARRALEYERIYHKPERMVDLAELRVQLPLLLRGCDVLELACGTGYWTQFVALEARTVTALDINEAVLDIARSKTYPRRNVQFAIGDAYAPAVSGVFDGGLAAFWFSHVPRQRQDEFLRALHACLQPGARVVLLDNAYVEGSSTPVNRVDTDGNSYQLRPLDDGSQYDVIKNFPSEDELRELLSNYTTELDYRRLPYYWLCSYQIG